ncbi:MAG: acyl-CoA dehydrogenase family protein [Acetobacteraceae bacterium]
MDMPAGGQPATTETDPIARARALAPLLEAAGPRIDAARELPPDVLDAMHGNGMFRLLVPRSLGGAELAPAIYIQVVEAIARGDASTAWCMNQGSGCSMTAAYLEPRVAREVFGDTRDVLAWGQGKTRATKVAGGWQVAGTSHFASGSRHSSWLGMHCPTFEADGTPRRHPDGSAFERTMLFRREIATITDPWQVLGLRGTGSDTYTVEDLFVPDEYSVTRDREDERRESGLLYCFTTSNIYASGFGAVGLGVARGMLDAFIGLAGAKTRALTTTAMKDNPVVQGLIGLSDAKLRGARTWLIRVLADAQDQAAATGRLSLDAKMDIRQAATFAIHQAREVVNALWHEAGATAIFDAQPFEHRFRDMNAVSQQVQGRAAHFETIGQHKLGAKANLRWV